MNHIPSFSTPAIAHDAEAGFAIVHPCEQLAHLLGDPLPADWNDPEAVMARQEQLAAASEAAAFAVVEALLHFRDVADRGVRACEDDAPVAALTAALVGLHRARGAYTHATQRGDALEVIEGAAERACGAAVAAVIVGLLERLGRDLARQPARTPA